MAKRKFPSAAAGKGSGDRLDEADRIRAESTTISVPVELGGSIFRQANFSANLHQEEGGLVQWGVQGDMEVLKSFSANKFPTLLGEPFMVGKTVIF